MDEKSEQIELQLKTVIDHLTSKHWITFIYTLCYIFSIQCMSLERFPDPQKAQTNLWKFAKMNEGRLYKLIRATMDPKSEYKYVYKCIKEIQARLKETRPVLEAIQILLRRVAFLTISKDTIPSLFEHIRHTGQGESKLLAETLIKVYIECKCVFAH